MSASFNDPDSATVAGPKPPPTVMRGPAHADNYRIKVGRYKERWYLDPLPADDAFPDVPDEAFPSVSTVKGASGKDWSYTTMKRLAYSDDLSEIAGRGYFERYERFKVINQLDLSAAMRRGTNVHTWAECIAYGIPQYLNPKGEGGAYFATVDKFFDDYQPKLVAAEFVCIDRGLHGIGYGGTSDGIFEIDGRLYMVDWKSRGEDSDHDCYPEEAGQLGAYIGCEYIIIEDDDPTNPHGARRESMPRLDGALIVSIKPDSYEVYPVDLEEASAHFRSMHAWWAARRHESDTVGHKWAPRRATTLEQDLQASLDQINEAKDRERRADLYARYDKMTKKQQAEFEERLSGYDMPALDVVEQLIDGIVDPPKLLDMAKARMEKDHERDADRRLSLEGGPADPDDIAEFELRWEAGDGMTDAGQRWVGSVVKEAIDAGRDFRLSSLNTQRRADIYCALVEWAAGQCDVADHSLFRTALRTVGLSKLTDEPLGFAVGSLSTKEAAELRHLVTEIVEGRMAYVVQLDGGTRWEPINESNESQS